MSEPNEPQPKYYDDQNILDIDFDEIYNQFIVPIDALRSHFNALVPNSQELNTPQYQESRINTFYRMIGFPVVAADGSYYSPGFDPNLNLDETNLNTYQGYANKVINDISITSQFLYRELIPTTYSKIFSDGGKNAQALALASIFIRSFDKQLGDTDPLIDDPNKNQVVDERLDEIQKIFGNDVSTEGIQSTHALKPFTVDPRIDSSIRPIKNRLCAPFLKDKSQTKIFQAAGASGNLKRPYIEKVISVRFNNANVTASPEDSLISQLINDISNDGTITNQAILDIKNNTLKYLHNSELTRFDSYYRMIRATIKQLSDAIRFIQKVRSTMNWQPIPDPKSGPEGGINGGKLSQIDPNDDKNNKKLERAIIDQTRSKILNDIDFDTGINGTSDLGDFAFSNLDDMMSSINKNVSVSFDDILDTLKSKRDQLGNSGIESLKNIEIIMGEFSGIGLIDMIAIQSALWIMDPNSLLGLIDVRAFDRIALRQDINISGFSQTPVIDSLKEFEKQLKNTYLLIQAYYDSLNNGNAFTV